MVYSPLSITLEDFLLTEKKRMWSLFKWWKSGFFQSLVTLSHFDVNLPTLRSREAAHPVDKNPLSSFFLTEKSQIYQLMLQWSEANRIKSCESSLSAVSPCLPASSPPCCLLTPDSDINNRRTATKLAPNLDWRWVGPIRAQESVVLDKKGVGLITLTTLALVCFSLESPTSSEETSDGPVTTGSIMWWRGTLYWNW